jgi:aspartokinase
MSLISSCCACCFPTEISLNRIYVSASCENTEKQSQGVVVQASSEHSVCFAVSSTEGERARGVLRAKFQNAIRAGRIQDVDVEKNCAVLAAVGQRMKANRGVAAKFFDAMATAGVNIKAIAQGSSEYNITVLVQQVRQSKTRQHCISHLQTLASVVRRMLCSCKHTGQLMVCMGCLACT